MKITSPDAAAFPVRYPRLRVQRTLTRLAGRLILPAFFRLNITGKDNFPAAGPLIVAGNHAAVMEVAMMFVYSPWLVEFFGGGDVPHEPISAFFARLVGYIPVMRGSLDRPALRAALGVLEQGGVLGVFPEGGVWQTGSEKVAQPGVAWLSAHSGAPVLPIHFSGTQGALEQALHFKRPALGMHIGSILPPAAPTSEAAKKTHLHSYAAHVLDAINALRPPGEAQAVPDIRDERFDLQIERLGQNGVRLTAQTPVRHPASLARLLHMPTVLKIFSSNLRLPIQALQTLNSQPPAVEIARACAAILAYLDKENPYLLTYRFGARLAEEMRLALADLQNLAEQAAQSGETLHVTPIRRYIDAATGREITQTEQGAMEHWM